MARRTTPAHPTRNVLIALDPNDAAAYQAKYTGVDDALIILVDEAAAPADAIIDQVHATSAVRAHPEYLVAAETLKAARGIAPAAPAVAPPVEPADDAPADPAADA